MKSWRLQRLYRISIFILVILLVVDVYLIFS